MTLMNVIEPVYIYRATVVRVIDGDTYDVSIDLGFKVSLRVHVRLYGYNAAELSTTEGMEVLGRARALLEGKDVIIKSYKDARSFERWVAEVWIGSMGVGELLKLPIYNK